MQLSLADARRVCAETCNYFAEVCARFIQVLVLYSELKSKGKMMNCFTANRRLINAN